MLQFSNKIFHKDLELIRLLGYVYVEGERRLES